MSTPNATPLKRVPSLYNGGALSSVNSPNSSPTSLTQLAMTPTGSPTATAGFSLGTAGGFAKLPPKSPQILQTQNGNMQNLNLQNGQNLNLQNGDSVKEKEADTPLVLQNKSVMNMLMSTDGSLTPLDHSSSATLTPVVTTPIIANFLPSPSNQSQQSVTPQSQNGATPSPQGTNSTRSSSPLGGSPPPGLSPSLVPTTPVSGFLSAQSAATPLPQLPAEITPQTPPPMSQSLPALPPLPTISSSGKLSPVASVLRTQTPITSTATTPKVQTQASSVVKPQSPKVQTVNGTITLTPKVQTPPNGIAAQIGQQMYLDEMNSPLAPSPAPPSTAAPGAPASPGLSLSNSGKITPIKSTKPSPIVYESLPRTESLPKTNGADTTLVKLDIEPIQSTVPVQNTQMPFASMQQEPNMPTPPSMANFSPFISPSQNIASRGFGAGAGAQQRIFGPTSGPGAFDTTSVPETPKFSPSGTPGFKFNMNQPTNTLQTVPIPASVPSEAPDVATPIAMVDTVPVSAETPSIGRQLTFVANNDAMNSAQFSTPLESLMSGNVNTDQNGNLSPPIGYQQMNITDELLKKGFVVTHRLYENGKLQSLVASSKKGDVLIFEVDDPSYNGSSSGNAFPKVFSANDINITRTAQATAYATDPVSDDTKRNALSTLENNICGAAYICNNTMCVTKPIVTSAGTQDESFSQDEYAFQNPTDIEGSQGGAPAPYLTMPLSIVVAGTMAEDEINSYISEKSETLVNYTFRDIEKKKEELLATFDRLSLAVHAIPKVIDFLKTGLDKDIKQLEASYAYYSLPENAQMLIATGNANHRADILRALREKKLLKMRVANKLGVIDRYSRMAHAMTNEIMDTMDPIIDEIVPRLGK